MYSSSLVTMTFAGWKSPCTSPSGTGSGLLASRDREVRGLAVGRVEDVGVAADEIRWLDLGGESHPAEVLSGVAHVGQLPVDRHVLVVVGHDDVRWMEVTVHQPQRDGVRPVGVQ